MERRARTVRRSGGAVAFSVGETDVCEPPMGRPKEPADLVGRSRRNVIPKFGGKIAERFGKFADGVALFERPSAERTVRPVVVLERTRRLERTFFAFPKSERNEQSERRRTLFFAEFAKINARFFIERGDDFFGRFFGQKGERGGTFAAVSPSSAEKFVVFFADRVEIDVA